MGKTDEKRRILDWAKRNGEKRELLWPAFDEEADTYFTAFDNRGNMVEYGFDSLPEAKKQMMDMWKGDSVMEEAALICSVAAFRERPRKSETKEFVATKSSDEIPEFVYVF